MPPLRMVEDVAAVAWLKNIANQGSQMKNSNIPLLRLAVFYKNLFGR
jgi:hypothetical protein